MYTIKREGDLGIRIVKSGQVLSNIYLPIVSEQAYLKLMKLVEIANKTVEKENKCL